MQMWMIAIIVKGGLVVVLLRCSIWKCRSDYTFDEVIVMFLTVVYGRRTRESFLIMWRYASFL
jgi:hypothetical protein